MNVSNILSHAQVHIVQDQGFPLFQGVSKRLCFHFFNVDVDLCLIWRWVLIALIVISLEDHNHIWVLPVNETSVHICI